MQNRINDQAAFILHRRDYQDSSLILELFSLDYGRLSVLVKGAKKRRDVAHFQICNQLLVSWAGRSELKILTQIESQSLSVSAEFYPCVFYINELLLYLLPKHEEHHRLFRHYQMLLLELSQKDTRSNQLEPLLRTFEIEMLSELGFMPDLSFDNFSHQEIIAGQNYNFDVINGVQPDNGSHTISFSGTDLVAINGRQFETISVLKAAKQIMRQIIDYNLQGRTLQSRKFYQQMKKK